MKFAVETALASGGRLGQMTFASAGEAAVTIETPMCTLFTKGGSAPHLSAAMLQRVHRLPNLATVSLAHFSDHHEAIRDFGKGIAEFSSTKNLVLTTIQDASIPLYSGKNDKWSIAVKSKAGVTKLTPSKFCTLAAAHQPTMLQCLSDGDTDKDSSRKKLIKSVDRTLEFLDTVLKERGNHPGLNDTNLLGVLEGGWCLEERIRSAKETALRAVDGFYIEGFQKGNSGEDVFQDEDFSNLLTMTLAQLPEVKPRVMECVWSPLQIVRGFRLGLDVFSSAYVHVLTGQGKAMVANFTLPDANESTQTVTWVDLNESSFAEQFSPLSSQCSCYTCSNFTCAYIHHLLNTSELLAYILLMIHNTEQYMAFFHSLRQIAKADRLDELEDMLTSQEKGQVERTGAVKGPVKRKAERVDYTKRKRRDSEKIPSANQSEAGAGEVGDSEDR